MLETIAAGALLVSLIFYALTGGADFGGGVWDFLARGPRAPEQRKLISRAIGPIWEANHVWLILALVILFTAFPPAMAVVSTKLHMPLTLMLVGIVFRGAAFTFRSYDTADEGVQQRWGRTFAIASVTTPVLLGAVAGATASGRLDEGYFSPWLAPFPLAVGVLALACFTYLAACYLAHEADTPELREDFRKRALVSGIVVKVLGLGTFVLARSGAPVLFQALDSRFGALLVPVAGFGFGAGAGVALAKNQTALARVLAIAEVVVVLMGWGLAQYPDLVIPGPTIFEAKAPDETLRLLIGALAVGAIALFPALLYLFTVFKGRRAFQVLDDDSRNQTH